MRIGKIAALGAIVVAATAAAPRAEAAFTLTMLQVGSDVVVNGSGSIDTNGVTLVGASGFPDLNASTAILFGGPSASFSSIEFFPYSTGPSSFGTGGSVGPDATSGNATGIFADASGIGVPDGYASGQALSNEMIFSGQTFASLGVIPGTYTWAWGSGANADSLTVQIGPAPTGTPEPASLVLLGTGLAALGLDRRHRRKGV